MFKLDLEKAEEPEIKLPKSTGSQNKQENSRKTCTSALLTMLKPLAVWITTGQEATEPDMEKWTGSKLGKKYVKAVYCQPVI